MLVNALTEAAAGFYRRWGFEPSPIDPMLLVRDLRIIAASAGTAP